MWPLEHLVLTNHWIRFKSRNMDFFLESPNLNGQKSSLCLLGRNLHSPFPCSLWVLVGTAKNESFGLSLCPFKTLHGRINDRNSTTLLTIKHEPIANHNTDPVQVIRDHRAVIGRIGPSKKRVENSPATTTS